MNHVIDKRINDEKLQYDINRYQLIRSLIDMNNTYILQVRKYYLLIKNK